MTKEKLENMTKDELLEELLKKAKNDMWKYEAAAIFFQDYCETDLSSLTVAELVTKIRAFVESDPDRVDCLIFLNFLARYPVSMCKRDISYRLKRMIGFTYYYGIPDDSPEKEGITGVSFEQLAKIFDRSKASVSMAVKETYSEWMTCQEWIQKQLAIEEEAKRELIEEKKVQLRQKEAPTEVLEQATKQTNE